MSSNGRPMDTPGSVGVPSSSFSRPAQAPRRQSVEAGQAAASSSRPTPAQRTLKQPMTLRVAESSLGPSSSAGGAMDKEEYFKSLKRKAELARRVDKWMDKLMEEPVDRAQFQRALSYMHAGQYGEVEHERHLNGLCSYPLCANKPSAPYRAQKRFQISSRAKTIKEVEGNPEEGFCSKRCRVKAQWVRENLGSEAAWLRGKVAPLELLEDMEERGELVWEGGKNGQYRRLKPTVTSNTSTAPSTDDSRADTRSSDNDDQRGRGTALSNPDLVTNETRHDQAPVGDDSSKADVGGLAGDKPQQTKVPGNEGAVSSPSRPRPSGSLRPDVLGPRHAPTTTTQGPGSDSGASPTGPARSRTAGTAGTGGTPGTRGSNTSVATGVSGAGSAGTGATGATSPTKPSAAAPDVNDLLDSLVIQERDTAHEVPVPPTLNPPPVRAVPKPKPPTAASARKARNTSSMIDGANSKLAQSVLTAHRQMKPVLQDEHSSDEDTYHEQDWEREMGWGGGEELDAMFEEARKARELA